MREYLRRVVYDSKPDRGWSPFVGFTLIIRPQQASSGYDLVRHSPPLTMGNIVRVAHHIGYFLVTIPNREKSECDAAVPLIIGCENFANPPKIKYCLYLSYQRRKHNAIFRTWAVKVHSIRYLPKKNNLTDVPKRI